MQHLYLKRQREKRCVDAETRIRVEAIMRESWTANFAAVYADI